MACTDCEKHRQTYGFGGCDIHVGCDEECGALNEPTFPEDILAALYHWRDHGFLNGCAHGNS